MRRLKHTLPIRVYFADTDALGIVHHATFMRFFEQARTEALRTAGITLPSLLDEYGVQFAVTALTICYYQPARVDDILYVSTMLKEKRQASLIYEQTICATKLSTVKICHATIKLACLGVNMQPTALPKVLRTGMLLNEQ